MSRNNLLSLTAGGKTHRIPHTSISIAVSFRAGSLCKEPEEQIINQGPVVQSVVSLTTSLRVISLTVLADPIHNILIFFAEKM